MIGLEYRDECGSDRKFYRQWVVGVEERSWHANFAKLQAR